ncbi:MAG: hypothetical protein K8Q89_03575 [Nitrosarchaeum sp.]|nr:hypothetical protein [Nitrosarchaeum sp.]
MQRIEQQRIEEEQSYQQAVEEEVQTRANVTHRALPKGFEPTPSPAKPAEVKPKGTLPKGF